MRKAVLFIGLAFMLSSCNPHEYTIVRSFIVHKEFSIVSAKTKITFKPGQHDLNGWKLNYGDQNLHLINTKDKVEYNLTSGEFNNFSFQYLKWNDGYPLAIEIEKFKDSKFMTVNLERHCKIHRVFSDWEWGYRTEKYFHFKREGTREFYVAYLLSPEGERIATVKVESTDSKTNDIVRKGDESIRRSSITEETAEDIRESLDYPNGKKISECREYDK